MITIENLSKTFKNDKGATQALRNVSLTINEGDIYGIIGMSGAGKSTLVRCINMLERPTEGCVTIDGCDMSKISERELREKRRDIGMIFQNFNLLSQKTCLKNICFPLELIGVPKEKARAKAMELLQLVGLPEKAGAYPSQLSGGQKQRIAIARALATDPKILLCDEATSALDPSTTNNILTLIKDINHKMGITVIIITHQMSVVEAVCNRVAILDHGTVAEEGNVSEIFASPQSDAARRLVYPDSPVSTLPICGDEHLVRIVFNGADATNTPLIARLAMEKNIAANILSASTRSIEGRSFGNMLLGITGGPNTVQDAISYLCSTEGITAQEVTPHVK